MASARAAGPRFGCAAITWQDRDDVAIDEIASLGYRGIQLRTGAFARWGRTPQVLRDLLASRNLALVAFSSGLVRLDPAVEAADLELHLQHARFVREAGGTFLQVVDERPTGRTPTAGDHARMGRLLTELGRRVGDLGLTLAYHNHMGNLGQAPDEVASVLAHADPKHVKLLLDIAHWHAAGGDEVAAVRVHADRLAFLHLKDVTLRPGEAGTRRFEFVELGRGSVNVAGVMGALASRRFDGWGIVELDRPTASTRSARECNRISRDYLASIGYTV
jgi:inosose dehydratase